MTKTPRMLRDQLRLYEREGFTVTDIIKTSKHWKVSFKEFKQFQILTASATDPRAFKNNIARFKRLAVIKGETK